jgi:prophage regulatory protein
MKLLRLPQVMERVGYRRSKIFALVKAGDFPKPVSIGPRARGFVETEIDAWISERIRERDKQHRAA